MQKSKKELILCVLLVIVIIVISVVCIFKKEKTDRVYNMYSKIQNSQNFTFSMEEVNSEIQYKVSVMQKGTDINIDMESSGEHTSTLILDGHAYFILHDEEEYYAYDSDDIDGDIILEGLEKTIDKEYVTGTETIFGQEYYYEEFEGITTFLILIDAEEDSTIKTRFYFDGDDIIYIKNIVTTDDEEQEELLKITLEYDNIDESAFTIPEDYAEI